MSTNRFEGKVAVVTGGNSGIGLAAAKAYAREGAKVAITGRDEKTLQAAARAIGPGTLALHADATKVAELERAFKTIGEKFGKIDALFVNAGGGNFVPFERVTEAFFDEIFDVNVKGLYFTIQKALPWLAKGSAVLLTSSINAHIAMPNSSVYGASKAALLNLAQTLSAELVGRGIRVNVVSPGPIQTPIFGRMGLPAEVIQQLQDRLGSQIPVKRWGRPEDIAAAALYLTAPESAFVVGTELVVDGGTSTLSAPKLGEEPNAKEKELAAAP